MATKTRAKAKRKKTTVAKTSRRRKTARKPRTIRKRAAKKAPPRRAARTKAKPTAKVAVKPRPVGQRAQPEAVKPPPSRPAQPSAAEQRIGNPREKAPALARNRARPGGKGIGRGLHCARDVLAAPSGDLGDRAPVRRILDLEHLA